MRHFLDFLGRFFGALDDTQFLLCVVEGREVALTPGVKLLGVGPPRVACQLVDSHVVDIHTVKESVRTTTTTTTLHSQHTTTTTGLTHSRLRSQRGDICLLQIPQF